MSESRLSVRIDGNLKSDAEEVFGQLGMTLTTAVTVFLRQSVRDGGLPFRPTTENENTLRALKEVADGATETFGSVDEWWRSVNED